MRKKIDHMKQILDLDSWKILIFFLDKMSHLHHSFGISKETSKHSQVRPYNQSTSR